MAVLAIFMNWADVRGVGDLQQPGITARPLGTSEAIIPARTVVISTGTYGYGRLRGRRVLR